MNPFKSKEKKDEKKQEKLEELMKQYNLEHLSQEDKEAVKLITYRMWGVGMIGIGAKAEDAAKISLSQAIIEQNWIIIKLLNEMNNKLNK